MLSSLRSRDWSDNVDKPLLHGLESCIADDAIEQFRHDLSTMGPLGDMSPITVRFVVSLQMGKLLFQERSTIARGEKVALNACVQSKWSQVKQNNKF